MKTKVLVGGISDHLRCPKTMFVTYRLAIRKKKLAVYYVHAEARF
jgi:hypothetical protein